MPFAPMMPDSPMEANWGPQHSTAQHCNRNCTILVATLVPLAALITIGVMIYLFKTRPYMRGARNPTPEQQRNAQEIELERRKIGDWESVGTVSRTEVNDRDSSVRGEETHSREGGNPWAEERDVEMGVKAPEMPVIKVRNAEAEEEMEGQHRS